MGRIRRVLRWGLFSLNTSRWLLARTWAADRNTRGNRQGAAQLGSWLPRLLGEERVDADAVHLRVRLVQTRHRIAERAQLLRAYGAECRGEEREDDRTAPLLAELDRLPILVGQGEVRGPRADVYRHKASIFFIKSVIGALRPYTNAVGSE